MENIIEKNFLDGRKIMPLIVDGEDDIGIGFKNVIDKEGEKQEGVIFRVPKYVVKDLIKLLKIYE